MNNELYVFSKRAYICLPRFGMMSEISFVRFLIINGGLCDANPILFFSEIIVKLLILVSEIIRSVGHYPFT